MRAAAARTGGHGPIGWVAGVSLAVIVAVPFVFIVLQAIFPELGRGSLAAPLQHLPKTLGDPALLRLAGNTLIIGLGVVAGCTLIGVPLAVVRALFKVPCALAWDVAFLVPFMIPPYIATLGWIMTMQPRGYLQQLTGFNLGPLLFSVPGMILIMSLNLFPVVYFAVSRTIEAVGTRYADVGRVFGARPGRAFFRITLPLATPGLAASLLLVFALAIEEYGTPAALGTRFGFEVLVTGIENRISDWPIDLPGAAILSLLLVALSLVAFLIQRRILSSRNFDTVGGKPQAKDKRPLGAWALPVGLAFALVALLATGVPLAAILATALSKTISGGLKPANMGLQNFEEVLGNAGGALQALMNSLSLGIGTALVAGALGALTAYAVVKGSGRGRPVLDVLAMLPSALPGVVVAVGMILAWNQPALPFTPYNTAFILLLAYCCILLPQPVRYATAAFQQIGDNLEAAARVAGAGPFTVFRRIMLPLILPSLITSMLLVFAVASRELVASLLVAPVGMMTIAGFIWRQFEQGSVGLGMTMSFIAIVLTTLIPMLLIAALRRFAGARFTGLH
ncbi:ABC transporter permease [Ancylobacter defluvii]|uniref:ABC transporter permease n=1 Tax=Ancylobacter defluvii TaxID=1282440 RepID=A0A9W6JVZ9_9HYPH|nr:iron ABC transporter permease [Ancylobacter defluvii]MBS7589214.1 iron ABC transporter permease [Ancylobacter defluvii]GLK84826.1 ABC transporter permease [Ancylobacter defluvii]